MKRKLLQINQQAPIVSKENFRILFPEIKDSSYDQNIKNWIKRGDLIPVKRGLYVFLSFWEKAQNKDEYLYYLASQVYQPSYVSLETVLAKHGILSEAVFGISSVSLKTTRAFRSKIAVFSYSKIKESLFTGFEQRSFFADPYFIATKAKALFDYLYLRKSKIISVNKKSLEELRLNLDDFDKASWAETEKYLAIADDQKLFRIFKLLRG
ncbi:MAG: hypothetical protein NT099_03160 [Candidatus Saganbacteria bacterium]|nr:hypothetical protein [Candidatus Saganbacteria bacterium]